MWWSRRRTRNLANPEVSGHLTVNQAVTGSCPLLEEAKVKQRRRGDKRHRQMSGFLKSGARKNLPLPHDLYVFGSLAGWLTWYALQTRGRPILLFNVIAVSIPLQCSEVSCIITEFRTDLIRQRTSARRINAHFDRHQPHLS